MHVWDCHWHLGGDMSADEILRSMDAVGLTRINLFGRAGSDISAQRALDDQLAALCGADRDRIYGLVRVDPRMDGIADEIERSIVELGLRGVKMLPDHWEPCDERLYPVYERIEALRVPLMFHSGILWGHADSSRFCRPALYEALLHFPYLRFSLAHIGWPWTDECLAVGGRFVAETRMHPEKECQVYIDLTPGTPPEWRDDALRKALSYLGPGRLIWGSDAVTTGPEYAAQILEQDRRLLLDVIGIDEAAQRAVFWDSGARMFRETPQGSEGGHHG